MEVRQLEGLMEIVKVEGQQAIKSFGIKASADSEQERPDCFPR